MALTLFNCLCSSMYLFIDGGDYNDTSEVLSGK
jgi:hypothetical protein